MLNRDSSMLAPQIVERANSWERLKNETKHAYSAFLLFRDSESRRLADVAKVFSCSKANIARWSARFRWQQRVFDWDAQQDRLLQAQLARDRSASRKRHLQISQEMQALALRALLEMKAKAASGGALNFSPTEIENMLSESIRLERLVLGTDEDRSKYTEIRVFVGTHHYENEPGYGEPQQFEELKPPPSGFDEPDEDGDDDIVPARTNGHARPLPIGHE